MWPLPRTIVQNTAITVDFRNYGIPQLKVVRDWSTHFDYYLRNMCLPFLEHLTEQLNTRFNKYGSMIHKMHAFFHQWLEWGKWKEIIRVRILDTNTEMIHPLPEIFFPIDTGRKLNIHKTFRKRPGQNTCYRGFKYQLWQPKTGGYT